MGSMWAPRGSDPYFSGADANITMCARALGNKGGIDMGSMWAPRGSHPYFSGADAIITICIRALGNKGGIHMTQR